MIKKKGIGLKVFIMMTMMMSLLGCEQTPPNGAVAVGKGSPFHYFPATLVTEYDGWHRIRVSMRDLVGLRDFVWQTDCQGRFMRGEQTLREPDGTMTARAPGDDRLYLISDKVDYEPLEQAVCQFARRQAARTDELTQAQAMTMLFGNYHHNSKLSRVQNICLNGENDFEYCPNQSEGRVKPFLYRHYQEHGVDKILLITHTYSVKNDFPSYLGGRVLTRVKNGWQIEMDSPYLMMAGSHQNPMPTVTDIQLGPQKHGFLLTKNERTGLMNKSVVMIIAPMDQKIDTVFSEMVAANNMHQCNDTATDGCWGFDSKVKFEMDEESEWWDIVLNREGKMLQNGELVDLTGEERYVMYKGRYSNEVIPEEEGLSDTVAQVKEEGNERL